MCTAAEGCFHDSENSEAEGAEAIKLTRAEAIKSADVRDMASDLGAFFGDNVSCEFFDQWST